MFALRIPGVRSQTGGKHLFHIKFLKSEENERHPLQQHILFQIHQQPSLLLSLVRQLLYLLLFLQP